MSRSALGIDAHTSTTAHAVFLWLIPQNPPARTDWNSCAAFVDYLVSLAVGATVPTVTSRISARELAATKLGIRMASESYSNYHQYINNRVDGFRYQLIEAGQGAGVYAHVLGNAGFYLYGGISGNAVRAGNDIFDKVMSFFKGQEGDAEVAGNSAGKQVGKDMWNYLKGGLSEADAKALKENLTGSLCQ